MPYKYYNQKTDVSLPLRQVESLFDTSDQWFQLPERLLVHWSWFESDLLNQKEYKTLFFILLSLYPSCILLVFTLVNIYYLLQLLRTVLFFQQIQTAVISTYKIQSMATISVMSSAGNPTDVSTITMVTRPAWGIPAAPILAAVAVMLEETRTVRLFRFVLIPDRTDHARWANRVSIMIVKITCVTFAEITLILPNID